MWDGLDCPMAEQQLTYVMKPIIQTSTLSAKKQISQNMRVPLFHFVEKFSTLENLHVLQHLNI